MSFLISDALADAAPGAAMAGDPLASMILPIGLVVLFYFFLIRPQSKRHKEHKNMIAALQKGEEIVTTGGLLGNRIHSPRIFRGIPVLFKIHLTLCPCQILTRSLQQSTDKNPLLIL